MKNKIIKLWHIGVTAVILLIGVFTINSWVTVDYLTSFLSSSMELESSAQSCQKQWHRSEANAAITFVIPSQGRESLVYTLVSLFNQTDPNWLAVVIFDGVASTGYNMDKESNIPIFLPRYDQMFPRGQLCFQHRKRVGTSNCAGEVRNAGIGMSHTPWIGFVDDDDTLHEDYVATLRREVRENPDLDAVVFRMTNGKAILPAPESTNFYLDSVGISYAVKRSLWTHDKYAFVPSVTEDYILLHRLRADRHPILLSADVMYFVKNQRPRGLLLRAVSKRAIISNDTDPHIDKVLSRLKDHWLQSSDRNISLACAVSPRRSALPHFVFVDTHSIIFGANVKGLNETLHAAIGRGCMSNWVHGSRDIEVHFTASLKPRTAHYIQIQMEQRGSGHFSPTFVHKLDAAVQVWEFSPGNIGAAAAYSVAGLARSEILARTVNTSSRVYHAPSYFVPSAVSTSEHFPSYNCTHSAPVLGEARFHIYRLGMYRVCFVHENGTVWNGPVRPSADCRGAECNATIAAAINSDELECAHAYYSPTAVLSFGLMEGSYRRQRESTCDRLQKALNGMDMNSTSTSYGPDHVLCLSVTFKSALQHFVCKADVIVVEHYFEHSALETHRIDPLIQAGKVVYVTPSSDLQLEQIYRDFVTVVPRADMVKRLKADLKGLQAPKRPASIMDRYARMRQDIDPVCHALQMLSSDFKNMPNGDLRRFAQPQVTHGKRHNPRSHSFHDMSHKVEGPQLVFSDANSSLFAGNVVGLNQTLVAALTRGCARNWRGGNLTVDIVMGEETTPASPRFVQVQMQDRMRANFSAAYREKLARAAQVWELVPRTPTSARTPAGAHDLDSGAVVVSFRATDVVHRQYHVPALALLQERPPVYNCAAGTSVNLKGSQNLLTAAGGPAFFTLYKFGWYMTCAVEKGVVRKVAARLSTSCSDELQPLCDARAAAVDGGECARAFAARGSVLSFGLMEGSYQRRRERMCERQHIALNTSVAPEARQSAVVCLTNTSGAMLEHFVCRAAVVVVEHFHQNSSLELHRIDPLIQAKKLVYVTPGADASLDQAYAPFVQLVPRESMLVRLEEVLRSQRQNKVELSRHAHSKFELARRNAFAAVCSALGHLSADVLQAEEEATFNGSALPTFLVRDADSEVLGASARGLEQALSSHAVSACLSGWTQGHVEIEVIFGTATLPSRPFFIQLLLDQSGVAEAPLASSGARAYESKLADAVQVWAFSPAAAAARNTSERRERAVYFVPSMSILPTSPATYNCRSASPPLAAPATFTLYRLGAYRVCEVLPSGRARSLFARPSRDCTGAECVAARGAAINRDAEECMAAFVAQNTVLSFGRMEGSHLRRRERLCDQLQSNITGFNASSRIADLRSPFVVCLTNTSGAMLEHFVCRAEVVVVEHFAVHSALETQRIDPLLQIKKLVYVTPSADKVLEEQYRQYLWVVRRSLMVKRLLQLLASRNNRTNGRLTMNSVAHAKFLNATQNTTMLCAALRKLASDQSAVALAN